MKTYEIPRVQGSPDWQTVPCVAIDNHLWSDVYSISASAQVAWNENTIFVRLQAKEQDILRRYREDFDPVYLDSCLEFFFCPTEGDDRFFNFEMNPNGALLVGFGADCNNRCCPDPQQWQVLRQSVSTAPFVTPDGWGITLQIPVSFVQAFVPDLYATLGLFIPLIVVNCLILGRAEAFAAKNGPVASMLDGLGMGLGFTIALTVLGGVREFLGTGKLFDVAIMPEEYGMLVFVLAPGAFIALGYLIAIVNKLRKA